MKRLTKVFVMAMAIGFCGVLTSSVSVSVPEITNEETCIEEEGIGCKVYNDNGHLVAKCFICNCAKLAEAARPEPARL